MLELKKIKANRTDYISFVCKTQSLQYQNKTNGLVRLHNYNLKLHRVTLFANHMEN